MRPAVGPSALERLERLERRRLCSAVFVTGQLDGPYEPGEVAYADFDVTVAGQLDTAVDVPYRTGDGTATADADFAAATGSLHFAADSGDVSHTHTVRVRLAPTTADAGRTVGLLVPVDTDPVVADGVGPQRAAVTIPSPLNAAGGQVGFTLAAQTSGATTDAAVVAVPAGTGTVAVFSVAWNRLDGTTAGSATVTYATADGAATAGDYTPTTGTLTLTVAHPTATVAVPIPPLAATAAGRTFSLTLATTQPGVAVALTSATATLPAPLTAASPFATGRPVTFDDGHGRAVVRLSGPGTGQLFDGGDGNGPRLVLSGTTAGTTLTFARRAGGGPVNVTSVTVDGPLRRLDAAAVDLTGDVAISGDVTAVDVGRATGAARLSFGGMATGVMLGTVDGTTVTAAGPLGTVAVGTWSGGHLAAPAIGTLRIARAFSPAVDVTGSVSAVVGGGTLGGEWTVGGSVGRVAVGATESFISGEVRWSANIGGSIGRLTASRSLGGSVSAAVIGDVGAPAAKGLDLRAATTVGSVTVGTAVATTVYAGVAVAVTAITAPTTAADLSPDGRIAAFTVTGPPNGGTLYGVIVAAAAVGPVRVAGIGNVNGRPDSTLVALNLARFTDVERSRRYVWRPGRPGQPSPVGTGRLSVDLL